MFKLMGLKWKREFEQLASIHRIAIAEKDAELERLKKDLEHKHKLELEEAVSLNTLNMQHELAQKELDYNRQLNDLRLRKDEEVLAHKDKLNKEFYESMTNAMTKLHQEGNITTKFVQDLALQMFDKAPETKVKVLTGKTE